MCQSNSVPPLVCFLAAHRPIFQQFQKLFNDRIESFITSQGSSLEQFVEACEKASEESFALQLIMGITSFDAFKELMLEQKRKVREDTEASKPRRN